MTYCLDTKSGWMCFETRPEPSPPADLDDTFKVTGLEPPPLELPAGDSEMKHPIGEESLTVLLEPPQSRWEKVGVSTFMLKHHQTELQVGATGTVIHEYELPSLSTKNVTATLAKSEPSALTPEGMIERGWKEPASSLVLMASGFAVLPLMTVPALGIGAGLMAGGIVKGAVDLGGRIDAVRLEQQQTRQILNDVLTRMNAMVDQLNNRHSDAPKPFVDLLPTSSKVEPLEISDDGVLVTPE